VSTPSLFPSDAKRRFTSTTADRYRHMTERVEDKGLRVPFSLAQLRDHVLTAMGDNYGGALKCRYCTKICDLSEVALDHAIPLARGGDPGLENIELPCARCNAAKGEATSEEWTAFMQFLFEKLPFARTDILHRLATYGKLVSGKRKAEMLLRNQGQFPAKKTKVKPPMVRAIEEAF
jgi:hypothetical protein